MAGRGLTIGGGGAGVTIGLLAALPSAAAGRAFYFATDDAGGTLYYSDGASWYQMSKRGELGTAQITANQTGFLSAGDVTGLTTTVTVGTRPIEVRVTLQVQQLTNASNAFIGINEGATRLQQMGWSLGIGEFGGGTVAVRLAPSPGSHTYKVQVSTGAGTVTAVGSATEPGQIEVIEL